MEYNGNRAADRKAAADRVEALARKMGVQVIERTEEGRGIRLSMTGWGVSVSTTFEAGSTWDFLAHWYGSEKPLADKFGFYVGGSVNPHHRRKATTHAADLFSLLAFLEGGWAALDCGKAFETRRRYEFTAPGEQHHRAAVWADSEEEARARFAATPGFDAWTVKDATP